MGKRGLATLIIVITWLAGLHHCAVESLLQGHVPHKAASQSDSQCPCHPESGPAGHAEGTQCTSTVADAAKPALPHELFAPRLVAIIVPDLIDDAASDFAVGDPTPRSRDELPPSLPLISLSISSNAPPLRA